MFARIGNLILALLFLSLVAFCFLATIWPDNWRLLSPPASSVGAKPFYDTAAVWTSCVLVVCIWVVSAAFLFDRRRFAWFGSLFGVGSAICLFVCLLISGFCGGFSKDEHLYSSGAEFVASVVCGFGFLIAFLTFSVSVFIGLIRNRTELVDI